MVYISSVFENNIWTQNTFGQQPRHHFLVNIAAKPNFLERFQQGQL